MLKNNFWIIGPDAAVDVLVSLRSCFRDVLRMALKHVKIAHRRVKNQHFGQRIDFEGFKRLSVFRVRDVKHFDVEIFAVGFDHLCVFVHVHGENQHRRTTRAQTLFKLGANALVATWRRDAETDVAWHSDLRNVGSVAVLDRGVHSFAAQETVVRGERECPWIKNQDCRKRRDLKRIAHTSRKIVFAKLGVKMIHVKRAACCHLLELN